jgi:hypothetical protein
MAESLRRAARIANCSGFYGDRIAAAREMLAGPIDVLTGDYLAELTMLILWKAKQKDDSGYATTFLRQLEEVVEDCLDRGIKIVVNAGGLNPAGLAGRVRQLAARLGLPAAASALASASSASTSSAGGRSAMTGRPYRRGLADDRAAQRPGHMPRGAVRPGPACCMLGRQGDAEGVRSREFGALLVEHVEFFDGETRGSQQVNDWPGEVAPAEDPLLQRVEAPLPAAHTLVGV